MKATDKASKTARTAPRELPPDPRAPVEPGASSEPAEATLDSSLTRESTARFDATREATLDGARLVAPVPTLEVSDAVDVADEIDLTDALDIEITEASDPQTTFAENAATSEGYEGIGPGDPNEPRVAALELPSDGELLMGVDESSEERPSRKRLEEQLEALKRKETELRRALVIADHPELADAIRALQGRAYAIGRVEAKLAQGLSKAEERRRETLDKKLTMLRVKRDELNTQIGALEVELSALGAERTSAFELERKQALEQLLIALGTHEPSLRAAGIDASTLVPELNQWLPEIEGLAERLVAERGVEARPEAGEQSELAAVSEVVEPLVAAPASPEQAPHAGASGI